MFPDTLSEQTLNEGGVLVIW